MGNIDSDELIRRIQKTAQKLNNADTINGLIGVIPIIYEMLDEKRIKENKNRLEKIAKGYL